MPVGRDGVYYKSMEDWSSSDEEEYTKRVNEAQVEEEARMEVERRRATCGARQRLAFATAMLGSVAATAGLGELPSDVLSLIGEAVASLGPPLLPVVRQQEKEDYSFLILYEQEKEEQERRDRRRCLVM
jgi:hypothetical protein